MEEFYLRFLFIEGGAYTLFGSKPITEIILDKRSKELKEKEYQDFLNTLTENEKIAIERQATLEWNPQYDFEVTWEDWEKSLDKEQINRFLLVHFPRTPIDLDFVYLVNILETATLLQKNYYLFRKTS